MVESEARKEELGVIRSIGRMVAHMREQDGRGALVDDEATHTRVR